jgi:hypothetical protein
VRTGLYPEGLHYVLHYQTTPGEHNDDDALNDPPLSCKSLAGHVHITGASSAQSPLTGREFCGPSEAHMCLPLSVARNSGTH